MMRVSVLEGGLCLLEEALRVTYLLSTGVVLLDEEMKGKGVEVVLCGVDVDVGRGEGRRKISKEWLDV
ncbi:hypothetical protein GWI33_000012 [Rhynchophorus ferrugineus]|uniref:Uncharacterized protein n=1 Tax=Rhynchophorus ferrugineus TaxID=354439 RepID=A0A834IYN8_RHYFE|nr:hypothetical protein GWI33_000012 [Rhynchophorus ferrugineus]